LFDDFFTGRPEIQSAAMTPVWPSMNLSEDDNAVMVRAELPGVDKKDVKINVNRDVLMISGEKREEKRDERRNYHRVECSYGSFSRQIRLPVEIDVDHIEAKMQDGVLMLKMPKSKTSPQKQIPVQ
jgi:HSP20 family protein